MDFRKFYIPTVMAGLALLTSANQAQAQTGVLDGYWGSDSSQHVNFIGTDGHVHELYINAGGGWMNSVNVARKATP